MTYNPRNSVTVFLGEHGMIGKAVLDSYNAADPLSCFYGCNSDEYIGYAERFIALWGKEVVCYPEQVYSAEFAEELVRRAFHPSQIVLGFVQPQAIKAVAEEILRRIAEVT